jgi:hypothetical protein
VAIYALTVIDVVYTHLVFCSNLEDRRVSTASRYLSAKW